MQKKLEKFKSEELSKLEQSKIKGGGDNDDLFLRKRPGRAKFGDVTL